MDNVNKEEAKEYDHITITNFDQAREFVIKRWTEEEGWGRNHYYKTAFDCFLAWCQGLPSALDTCYFYNRSAIKNLAVILEETPRQALKHTQTEAELFLTKLIFKELNKRGGK